MTFRLLDQIWMKIARFQHIFGPQNPQESNDVFRLIVK